MQEWSSRFMQPRLSFANTNKLNELCVMDVSIPRDLLELATTDIKALSKAMTKYPDLTAQQLQGLYVYVWNARISSSRVSTSPYNVLIDYLEIIPQSKLGEVLIAEGPIKEHFNHVLYDFRTNNFARSNFLQVWALLPEDREVRKAFVNSYPQLPQRAENNCPYWGKYNEPVTKIYQDNLSASVQLKTVTANSNN